MFRFLTASLILVGFVFTSSALADWSDSVFPVKKHDFGAVAVAAKTEFRFPIHNTTGRRLHIQTVRTSCGCTTPIVETPYIEPGQAGAIVARFNTDTFRGKRGATITVVLDQPFYSEVRLRVDGYIRQDMVFHPGAVEFGKVAHGEPLEKSVKVLYAGRDEWAILDVISNQPWMTIDVSLESRGSQRVSYELLVKIAPTAPVGYFQDELIVVTNDRAMPRVPLRVSGDLEADLSISPQSIAIGTVKPGEEVEKRLVVRGKDPFVIESITCPGWDIVFEASTQPKPTHILMVVLRPTGDAVGSMSSELTVQTREGSASRATALVTANVRER